MNPNQKPKMEAPGANQDYTKTVPLREFTAGGKRDGDENDPLSITATMPLGNFKQKDLKKGPLEDEVRIIGINRKEIETIVRHARSAHLDKFVKEMNEADTPNKKKIAQINLYNNFSDELNLMVEAQQLTPEERDAALKSIEKHISTR